MYVHIEDLRDMPLVYNVCPYRISEDTPRISEDTPRVYLRTSIILIIVGGDVDKAQYIRGVTYYFE